tara:strand:- start:393 stop:827 length:435 start_codon:yes stop_codon:yes gene_type:complete
MKSLIISLLAFGLLSGPVSSYAAKEKPEKSATKAKIKKDDIKKKPSVKKSAPEIGPLAFSGKVSKKETKGKDGKIYRYYSLMIEGGKTVRLTKSALGKKSKVDLDDLVDVEVTIAGEGYESGTGKKKRVILKKIQKIEKADSTG